MCILQKNNTDDGVYTVFTGEKDMSKLGVIDKYNGTSMLKFWTTDSANMINGSGMCPVCFVVGKPHDG